MASEPTGVEQPIRFGEGYEVDLRPRRLRRGSYVLKLERIPFEILLLGRKEEGVAWVQRARNWTQSVSQATTCRGFCFRLTSTTTLSVNCAAYWQYNLTFRALSGIWALCSSPMISGRCGPRIGKGSLS